MQRVPMTTAGAEALRKELDQLKKVDRPRISAAIAEAREHGDLKENAEYHAAREQHGFCEGRIQDIESKLSNAQIISLTIIQNTAQLIFGLTLTIVDVYTHHSHVYHIITSAEDDRHDHPIVLTPRLLLVPDGPTVLHAFERVAFLH